MHRLRRRAGAITAVLLATAGLAGVTPRAAAIDVAQSASVQIVQSPMSGCPVSNPPATPTYCLEPPTVTVKSGATVTWTNETAAAHTVTRCPPGQHSNPCPHGAGTGNDRFGGPVASGVGETYSFTSTSGGTYYYFSQDDQSQTGMQGEVTVKPSATSPTPVQLSPGAATAPSDAPLATAIPTPSPTPIPTASPSDSSAAVAMTTPSSDPSPAASGSFPIVAGGNTGGGSSLVIIVLVILTLIAVGGGVLSFRLYRR
jgi:plastocyanin